MVETCPHCGAKLEAVMFELVSYPDARVDDAGGLKIQVDRARLLSYHREIMELHYIRCIGCKAEWNQGKDLLKTVKKFAKKAERERKRTA